jgi:protein-S-isoprenylcysteine O-methyltransferase Ste14
MTALTTAIIIIWTAFWGYWLIAAFAAKESARPRRTRAPGLVIAFIAFVLIRVFHWTTLAVHSPVVQAVGAALLLAGLALAVWARVYLGRNWGMPMTQRAEPELVTSGPYAYVRHPIYSGILLAILGTALATNLYWLIGVVLLGAYFAYSATVEERTLATTFPTSYASYRTRTKMLVPFVL